LFIYAIVHNCRKSNKLQFELPGIRQDKVKKPFFLRIIGLAVVYAGTFILLVVIQFANRRGFVLTVGDFVVSGNFGAQEADEAPQGGERLLEGRAVILYGGMEFFLTDDGGDNSLCLLNAAGGREHTRPVAMTLTEGAALFRLAGGASVSFANRQSGGIQEVRISADLPQDGQALELPYRLLRSSRIRRNTDGESQVVAGGKTYRFDAPTVDFARRLIILTADEPAASYGTVPGTELLDPSRFILAAARDRGQYDGELNRWRDRCFELWSLAAGNSPDEETALALLAEAASRGSYRAAVAALSAGYGEGAWRSFMASVYLGRMDQGLRAGVTRERDTLDRLARLVAEGSADFLLEPHALEFLSLRGRSDLADSGAGIVRSLDSAGLDLLPGILEGYADWLSRRPGADNPFAGPADRACLALSEHIRAGRGGEQVLVFDGETANVEFNCRLGAALTAYGEHTGQEVWAGLGRSLALSALALVDGTGAAPLVLRLGADGEAEAEPGATLSSARIYRLLGPGEYFARAVDLHNAADGVWAWTAASGVTAAFDRESTMLDISASFPRGETHYMFIRGIEPFAEIWLYNQRYRTDPRFEAYDSSGWTYSPSEQTLMVKMKHQLATEHIQIYY
jgi:hypothetical protein